MDTEASMGKGAAADAIVSKAASTAAASLGEFPRPRDTAGEVLKMLRLWREKVQATRKAWREELGPGGRDVTASIIR